LVDLILGLVRPRRCKPSQRAAPRRAAIRPGIYLSHFPGLAPLDFRVEAVSTDPPTSRSNGGQFLYAEEVQKEGYTNKGYILGDPIGRESKGGQAWLTYHLSPREERDTFCDTSILAV
jgi:Capsule assembly protein Wzi